MIAYVSATQATINIAREDVMERVQRWLSAHIQSPAQFELPDLSHNYNRVVVRVSGEPTRQLCIKTDATNEDRIYHVCVPDPNRQLQKHELPLYVIGPDERLVMILADVLGQSFVPEAKFGQLIDKLSDKLAKGRQDMNITNITVKHDVADLLEYRDFTVKSDRPLSITQFTQNYANILDEYREWEFVRVAGSLGRSEIALQDTGVLMVDPGEVNLDEQENIRTVLTSVRWVVDGFTVDGGLWTPKP